MSTETDTDTINDNAIREKLLSDDAYLRTINIKNQTIVDELKNMCVSINNAEDVLREKIRLIYSELNTLNKDYIHIMEMYSQIIKSSVQN